MQPALESSATGGQAKEFFEEIAEKAKSGKRHQNYRVRAASNSSSWPLLHLIPTLFISSYSMCINLLCFVCFFQRSGQWARACCGQARMALLGAYGHYLRPYIGEHLDKAITNIKPVLDTVLPQEG